MNKEDKIKRLEMLIAENGGTQTNFANKLGIKQQNISDMLLNKRAIGKNFINSLFISFGVNPEWMETGEGDMYLTQKSVENTPETVTIDAKMYNALLMDLREFREQATEARRDRAFFIEQINELKKTAAGVAPSEDATCAAAS